TQSTSPQIVHALVDGHTTSQIFKRSIALIAAEDVGRVGTFPFFEPDESSPYVGDELGRDISGSNKMGVFVAQTPELPTIGLQDRYAAQLGRAVTRLLPTDDALLEQCWQQGETLRQFAPDAALTRAVDFVARFIAHQTVGIAFGGGGARGFAHLGVLDG